MNNFTLTFVLFCLVTGCSRAAEAQQPPSFGVKVSDVDPGIVIRDFSDYPLNSKDRLGIERYGFGSGQLELSNRPQIIANNRSGVLLGAGKFRMGIEPANGMVSYQNRPDYEWTPAVSAGLKLDLGLASLYAGPRIGYTYTKYQNDTVTGGIISAEFLGTITGGYYIDNLYNYGIRKEYTSITAFDKLNLEKQTVTDKGDTYILSWRFNN